MILLDTDHLTVLKYTDSERYTQLYGCSLRPRN